MIHYVQDAQRGCAEVGETGQTVNLLATPE